MHAKILIVDDDRNILVGLQDFLQSLGYQTDIAESGEGALEKIQQNLPDLILLDLSLPNMSGLEVLQHISNKWVETSKEQETESIVHGVCQLPVIVMTAYGSIKKAVEAMKLGAYDFFSKPFDMDYLTLVITKALERNSLINRVALLRQEVDSPYATMVGESPQIQDLKQQLQLVANSTATVLLSGETGTGKVNVTLYLIRGIASLLEVWKNDRFSITTDQG